MKIKSHQTEPEKRKISTNNVAWYWRVPYIVVLVNICCNFQNFNFQSLTMAPVKIDYFVYWRPQPIVEWRPFLYHKLLSYVCAEI